MSKSKSLYFNDIICFREPEPQIMSYLTQQHKLFPLVAAAYAFHFVQLAMLQTYSIVSNQIADGDFSRSQEVKFYLVKLNAFMFDCCC